MFCHQKSNFFDKTQGRCRAMCCLPLSYPTLCQPTLHVHNLATKQSRIHTNGKSLHRSRKPGCTFANVPQAPAVISAKASKPMTGDCAFETKVSCHATTRVTLVTYSGLFTWKSPAASSIMHAIRMTASQLSAPSQSIRLALSNVP